MNRLARDLFDAPGVSQRRIDRAVRVVREIEFADIFNVWDGIEPRQPTGRAPDDVPYTRCREETVSEMHVEWLAIAVAEIAVLHAMHRQTFILENG